MKRHVTLAEEVAKVRDAEGCTLAEAGARVLADIVRDRPRIEGVPARRQIALWSPHVTFDPEPVSPFLKFERISDGYWWSAAAGDASVQIDFERGTVFYGGDGYVHVRIVLPEPKPPKPTVTRTGFPGRPAKGKGPILAEFRRRVAKSHADLLLDVEVAALLAWFGEQYPEAEQPTPKTVENNIRAEHRKWLSGRRTK